MLHRISARRQFLLGCLTLLTVVAWAQPQITYKINTFAGLRVVEDGIPAIQAQLHFPEAVAVDGSGNLYIADTHNNSIRKIDATGTITTVAGMRDYGGYRGDGGPASWAFLNNPAAVTVDSAGNLYIADTGNERIRILTPSTVRTRLDFAHFANGDGITSDLVFVNVATHPIQPGGPITTRREPKARNTTKLSDRHCHVNRVGPQRPALDSLSGGRTGTFPYIECVFSKSFECESIA